MGPRSTSLHLRSGEKALRPTEICTGTKSRLEQQTSCFGGNGNITDGTGELKGIRPVETTISATANPKQYDSAHHGDQVRT